MLMFEELSDIFSDHNNHLTSRELLMKVRKWGCTVLWTLLREEEKFEGSLAACSPLREPKGTETQDFGFLCQIKEAWG